MAFADPQTVMAATLPRTFFEGTEGRFTSSDGDLTLRVSHTYGKRTRRLIRIDKKKISVDPLNPNISVPSSMSVQLVVDIPVQGFSIADQKAVVDGLNALLTASTGAATTKLLGGES